MAPLGVLWAISVAVVVALLIWESDAELSRSATAFGTVLAESAQMDYMQGDKATAMRAMQRVIGTDPSVRQIVLLGRDRTPLLAVGDAPADRSHVEVEVAMSQRDAIPTAQPRGYVRVTMAHRGRLDGRDTELLAAIAALTTFAAGCALAAHRPLRAWTREWLKLMGGAIGLAIDKDVVCAEGNTSLADVGETQLRIREKLEALRQRVERAVEQESLQAAAMTALRTHGERQRLLAHDEQVREQERKKIAQELHDTFGAGLVALRMYAETVASRASKHGHEDVHGLATRMVATCNDLYDTSRRITEQLRPELLEALGLEGAISDMVRKLDQTHPQCRFRFLPTPHLPELPAALALTAYRVCQEALTNVVKHAQARAVTVTLAAAEPPHHLRMVVADDGKGIDALGSESSGMGIVGMRERVSNAGGALNIASDAVGTVVSVLL